jgi:O-antigen ligase
LVAVSLNFLFSITSFKKALKDKRFYFSLAIVLISILFSINAQNRGFFIAFLIIFLYLLIQTQIVLWKTNRSVFYKTIIIFCAIVVLATLFLLTNPFGLTEKLLSTSFVQRILSGGSDTERLRIYSEFFSNFWRFPFGGMSISSNVSFTYVHNLWLDIYSEAGFLPFLSFLFVTIFPLVLWFRNNPLSRKTFIPGSYVLAVFSISFFEPVFQGNFYIVLFLIFALGGLMQSKDLHMTDSFIKYTQLDI